MKEEMRYSVVRRGTSLVLAATLTTSMVPAIALAQDGGNGDAAPVVLSDEGQQKQYNLEVGKAYRIDVAYGAEDSMAAMVQQMIGKYFGNQVDVVAQADGTYNVVVSFIEYSAAIGDMTINGNKVSQSADHTYTFNVSSLDDVVNANIVIGGAMAGMFPNGIDYTMSLDTSTLPVKEADAAYETGFSLYFKGAAYDASRSFQDKVKVTPSDGGYTVELTANSLGEGNTLGDITYAGVKVPKTVHDDGSATYAIPLPSVDGTYDITFGYTVNAGPMGLMTNLHPFQLVIGNATPNPSSVDKTGLTKQIVAAEQALSSSTKTDSANAALQKAIDDAYAAVDLAGGTEDGIATALSLLNASIEAFNNSDANADPKPGQDDQQVDKTALNKAIADAKAIQQGNKTDEAYAALQEAIATAEKAAANDKIPQAGVDAVLGQLNDAVLTFNTSADKPAEEPSNPGTKADFKLEQGKEYTVPAKLVKADGSDSMAAQYFESNATVIWDGSHYKVRFGVTEAGSQYIKGVAHAGADATNLGNNQYEVTVDSLTEAIELTFGLSTPMGDMQQSAYLSLDTTSLPTTTGDPIKPQEPSDNQGGNNNNNQNNNSDSNQNTSGDVAEQGFQVGHTYQVPTSWLKHDSSEESMAAKYFGDTALVRPQSDGTFKVSFSATSEGASHIISLAYNGSTLAQSGNQYTVSIPKADSDTVVPISMTIKEMEQLGGGAQVADMHLKLSQAKDLGTGQDGVVASSSTSLAKTGDNLAGVAGAAAVAAVVAGGVAVAARRRSNQQ